MKSSYKVVRESIALAGMSGVSIIE